MNICLITSSYPLDENDTAAPFAPHFIRAVEEHGHRVVVFTQTKPGAPIGWNDDERVYYFKWMASGERVVNLKFRSPGDLVRMVNLLVSGEHVLQRIARECDIAVCLALWAIPSGIWAMRMKQRFGIPYAVWALGSDINTWAKYPGVRTVVKQVLANADARFADGIELGHKTAALAGKECGFLATIRVLPRDQPSNVCLEAGRVHFLFVGRWEPVKGVDVLLEAFRLLTHEIGNDVAVLHLLGSGSLTPMLQRFIADNHLGDAVQLVPNAPTSELIGYFQQASCLVIPSRSESIPVVLGEALQFQLPLIVTDVGDMGALAREYNLGRVVPPTDVRALMQAMRDFVTNGATPESRGQALLARLDVRTSAAQFLDVMIPRVKDRKGNG